jgi:hypothetical protein
VLAVAIVILSSSYLRRLFEASRSGELRFVTSVLNDALSSEDGCTLLLFLPQPNLHVLNVILSSPLRRFAHENSPRLTVTFGPTPDFALFALPIDKIVSASTRQPISGVPKQADASHQRLAITSGGGAGSDDDYVDDGDPDNPKKRKRFFNDSPDDVTGIPSLKMAKQYEEALHSRNSEIRELREELNQKNALIAELLLDNDKLRRETFELKEQLAYLQSQYTRVTESLQEFAESMIQPSHQPTTIEGTSRIEDAPSDESK